MLMVSANYRIFRSIKTNQSKHTFVKRHKSRANRRHVDDINGTFSARLRVSMSWKMLRNFKIFLSFRQICWKTISNPEFRLHLILRIKLSIKSSTNWQLDIMLCLIWTIKSAKCAKKKCKKNYIDRRKSRFALQCFDTVGWATGSHPACKKLGVGLLVVMIWLELYTSYNSSCYHSPPPSPLSSNKIQYCDIPVPANPGPPGKWPWKRKICLFVWLGFNGSHMPTANRRRETPDLQAHSLWTAFCRTVTARHLKRYIDSNIWYIVLHSYLN